MFSSEYIMDAIANGREGGPMGNRHPHRAPQGCYAAAGQDQWVTLSVGSDAQWQALCAAMKQEDLAEDSRFANVLARQRNHDQIDEFISEWTSRHDKYELMRLLQEAGIPAGPVLTGKDIHFDPQYQSRGFLERVTYPEDREMGTRIIIGRPYKFSRTPLQVRGPAPAYGQDNQRLLTELLGVEDAAYQDLVQDSIVADVPLTGEPVPRIPPEESVEKGLLAAWDPDYRERLDIHSTPD